MNSSSTKLRQAVVPLVCMVVLATLYFLARLPSLSSAEAEPLAERFRFEKLPLPEPEGFTKKYVRQVHPCLKHMASWMSSLGAAVALGDLDGDGLPNDVCSVDPRIDQVVIAPVPGTKDRYEPFVLNPSPLPFNDTMAPMGSLLGDFNEDGRMDVLVYYWGRSSIIWLQRAVPASEASKGLNAQSFVPTELIEPFERWSSNAATHADLDGDGHYDLIVCNYGPDGTRILDPNAEGCEQMQHSMSRAFNGGKKHFFLWEKANNGKDPAVKFKRVEHGLNQEASHGWTLGIGCADLDGDGLPEVYISNDFGPDRLLHNRSKPGELKFALLEGRRTLTTPRSRVLGRDSFKGMGIDFADVNGDGLLDMYVSNLSGPWSIFESHFLWINTGEIEGMKEGIAPFRDEGEKLGLSRSGWAWDSRLGDFDNDSILEAVQAHGFLKGTVDRWPEVQELALANDQLLSDPRFWPAFRVGIDDLSGSDRNCFFVRAADGRYYDIARKLGVDGPMVSRGIALADVDGDGRLDYAAGNQWQPSFFFHNTAPNPGSYLGLHLRLPVGSGANEKTTVQPGHPQAAKPSRPAIGAAVTVHLPNGKRLVSQVDGGSGHSGKRAPDIHFGLGDIKPDTKLRVDVKWRGGDGKLRSRTFQIVPGWHTVNLGLEPSEEEVANRE